MASSEPARDPSDQDLFAGIAAGDATALRRLIGRYDRLIRYAVYQTGRERCRRDPLWLDSVSSEVWTDLCRSTRKHGEQAIDNVPSFLIQIARRRSIDALRRRGEKPPGEAEEAALAQLAVEQEDTAAVLVRMEELSALRECVSALGTSDRALCGELDAITAGRWREAASRLNMPESTLRSRWKRVLGRLRTCLEARSQD